MILPQHKGELSITHNEHKSYYQTAEEYYTHVDDDEWVSEDSKIIAITNDDVWKLLWYPHTPVGFYTIYGSSIEEVILEALKEKRK